jgi:hypothetical protein
MEQDSLHQVSDIDDENFNWLKIAERAFEFWDNEMDEIWDDV